MTPIERLGFAVSFCRWLSVPWAQGSILSLLVQVAPDVLRHEQLAARVGLRFPKASEQSVKVHIHHLRQALDDVGHPGWIEGSWGEGYRFTGDVDALTAAAEPFA